VLGFVADVTKVWARAHVAVLPSRREGFRKVCWKRPPAARAIVATDVPGCRESRATG
jgi:hypothetical protein